MDVRLQQGNPLDVETPLLVLPIFEVESGLASHAAAADEALAGLLARLRQEGELSGEATRITLVHNPGGNALRAARVALVGLGKPEEFDLEAARVAAALAARKARELKLNDFAFVLPEAPRVDVAELCRVCTEAAILSLYRYEQFKEATKSKFHGPGSMAIVAPGDDVSAMRQVVELAQVTCEVMARVRDLSVGPGNVVTPTYLAEQARQVAQAHNLEITVWGKDELREKGMHGVLAVNSGSAQPPVFVAMRYRAEGAARTLAVIGKGITFDSGGISIKPAEGMEYMRHDMTGAATVIGFLELAARTRLPVNVLGVFAATENLPSGSSYKPGDVFRAYNGKTMEIVNTDAEGRVILSDALAYAAEQQPDAMIDLATLTGACGVALGDHATGTLGNNQPLIDLVTQAGEKAGDRCWQLPLWKVYKEQVKTAMADVRNTGGRKAGAITAAWFLQEFVGEIPWVHLDIASTAYAEPGQTYVAPYNPKPGATGVGVRLLWHFCQAWSAT